MGMPILDVIADGNPDVSHDNRCGEGFLIGTKKTVAPCLNYITYTYLAYRSVRFLINRLFMESSPPCYTEKSGNPANFGSWIFINFQNKMLF